MDVGGVCEALHELQLEEEALPPVVGVFVRRRIPSPGRGGKLNPSHGSNLNRRRVGTHGTPEKKDQRRAGERVGATPRDQGRLQ